MRRPKDTPFSNLQQVYRQLAQSLRSRHPILSLSRLEILTRHIVLQFVLTHLLRRVPHVTCQQLLTYYRSCLSSVLDSDLIQLSIPDEEGFRAIVAREVDNVLQNDVIPAVLLGLVYEQSLAYHLSEQGQELVLSIGQDVRQREGVYYTPPSLVSFVLERTLGRKLEDVKQVITRCLQARHYAEAQTVIEQLRTLKIVDISCGSGVFLLHAYLMLIQAYKWWNQQVEELSSRVSSEKISFEQDVELQIECQPLCIVLQLSILGIDCDAEAVAITRVGLLLLYVQQECEVENTLYDTINTHIVTANALDPTIDITTLFDSGPQTRIIVGNPPWGTALVADKLYSQHYTLARGQYDSYELFIERATSCLRNGDMLGYVIPDSLLHLPQHVHLRRYLLQRYQMETILKVGEGLFDGVFRGVVVFSAIRNEQVAAEHTIPCCVMVKAERASLAQQVYTLQEVFASNSEAISQVRLLGNKDHVFDLYVNKSDEILLRTIEEQRLDWQVLMSTGRGVEVARSGAIMQCSYCGCWQNIPRKQKNASYPLVNCTCCAQIISYEHCLRETIISDEPTSDHRQPILVGEHIHRYKIGTLRYIDVSKGRQVNYKTPALYAGEKLLVRKTGRGIYATIDRSGVYTNQVVFIFRLLPHRPKWLQQIRLSYVLGVLNSRMMLYYYYKIFGDIEWKSFPYMTQRTIMCLPLRSIDFDNSEHALLHKSIADLVDNVLASGQPPSEAIDAQIEHYVRTLYGVHTDEMSDRIDDALQRIKSYGPLLGAPRQARASFFGTSA